MKTQKRNLVLLGATLFIIFIFSMLNVSKVLAYENNDIYYYQCGEQLEIEYRIISEWDNHYNVTVVLNNVSDDIIRNWSVCFDSSDVFYDIYNADYINGIFCAKDYNQDIFPGGSVIFGFTASYDSEEKNIPTQFVYCTEQKNMNLSDFYTEFDVLNSYGNYAQGVLKIKIVSNDSLKAWTITFDVNCNISNVYNASLKNNGNNNFSISSPSYYPNISLNEEYAIYMQLSNYDSENLGISDYDLNIFVAGGKDASEYFDNIGNDDSSNEDDDINGEDDNNNGHSVSDNDLIINLDEYTYNSGLDYYQIDTSISALNGQLYASDVSEMFVSVYDIHDNQIFYKEIIPDTDWSVEDFGLVSGMNYVTVSAFFNNGDVIEKSVVISNLCRDNMNNTSVDLEDTDQDGISNYEEEILGLDPDKTDSDDDLITDIEEIVLSMTDPLAFDSDNSDTDFDGLTDYDERSVYGTDPFMSDSDEDGVYDGDEIYYGLDPLYSDSDTTVNVDLEQSIETDALVDAGVNLACSAEDSEKIYIFPMNSISTNGIVGVPVEFYVPVDFDTAEIWFSYDSNLLGGVDENDLCIAWLDPSVNRFVLLDDSTVDTAKCKVSCVVDHFSTYALVDKNTFIVNVVSDITVDVSNINYDINTGHSYMVMTTTEGWIQAETICENYGGHLVTINSQEEQKFVELIMNKERYSRYWIGAYSEGYPYEFKWITGEEFLYNNWSVGEPNSTNEFFAEIIKDTNYKWNNLPEKYTYTNAFICEWDNASSGEVIKCSSDYIIVDSINYFPICDSFENNLLSNQPEIEPWTNDHPKNSSGEYIYGLENLYNSMSSDQLAIAGYTLDSLLKSKNGWDIKTALIGGIKIGNYTIGNRAGIFLKHYLNNIGDTQIYTCDHGISDYNYHREENILNLINSCSDWIKEGETTIIATAPEATFTGLNVMGRYNMLSDQILYITFNSIDFLSINNSNAVFVAECTKESGIYYFYMKYYLLDYYDFSPNICKELYLFNLNGIAKSFVTIGEDSFYGQYDGTTLMIFDE